MKTLRTILEAQRETPVVDEVDVIVAGGGPAGFAAAVAAARNGADVLLVERYGYLGGMATGGLVICLVETDRYGYGICKEILERLRELGGARLNRAAGEPTRWVQGSSLNGEESWFFDPEALKYVAGEVVTESGADLLLHSLVVGSVTDGNHVQGLILEGKSGRQAVLGRVVVDATGDGDVAASSGAPFSVDRHPWGINLEFRIGGVDIEKSMRWKIENPELHDELMRKVEKDAGRIRWGRTVYDSVVWGHGPPFYDVDGLDGRHLTRVEVESRKRIVTAMRFFRDNIPGFEDAFLMDIAPQTGVRETRRIIGEYTLTREDETIGRNFDDNIAGGLFGIPYRCIVPKVVDGLLVAGRCMSATHEAQGAVRNIPSCLVTGQAAGTAAALAAKHGVTPRELDIHILREALKKQGVRL